VRGSCPKRVRNPSPGSLRSPPSPYGRGQKAKRHRPVFCSGDGCACLFSFPSNRGSGAPNGASTNTPRMKPALLREPDAYGVDISPQSSLRRLRRLICVDAAPVGAPLRRFWASGPYFRARMERSLDYEPLRPTCLGGFRRPSPCRVQPLKAAPRSWSGRLPLPPGAWLRATPQAPHLAPPNRTPLDDAPG
jgi:hypothetical protein